MPTNKDFKRLVRARMQKTGEAYTAARAQLLRKQPPAASASAPVTLSPAVDYSTLAGMADATIKAKTGCTWKRWVQALDRVAAYEWSHREIADYVSQTYKVPGWWTQAVTVGYERIKGLRDIGQRRGGGYEASKSKVFQAPVSRVYRAFHDARTRRRWLGDVRITIRTATSGKTMRVNWPDGTAVDLYFVAKGPAKSQVAVQHKKLVDREAVTRMKTWWADRFGALEAMLAASRPRSSRAARVAV